MSPQRRFFAEVLRARSLAQAAELVADADREACFVAGATALQLEWIRSKPAGRRLVDVTRLRELAGVSETATGGIRIGAATRLAALERDTMLRHRQPLLIQAIATIAAPGVRELATIGGNIATRTGCLIPPLLAQAALLEIFEMGQLITLPLRAWLQRSADANRLLVAVILRPMPAHRRVAYRKVGLRWGFTPSVVGAAGVLALDADGRIGEACMAVGGGITPPHCLDRAVTMLRGQQVTAVDWHALRQRLYVEIAAPGDHRYSAHYRNLAAANALVTELGDTAALDAICPVRPVKHFTPAAAPPPTQIEVSRHELPDRWRLRPDIKDKVLGRFTYLTDHRRPGMLVARILRADLAHARIISIDTSRAEAMPGVAAVVTASDIKGRNGYGIVLQDQPALCADKVRCIGDPVAAVAADDDATARAALTAIRVAYAPLPVVDDMEAALGPDAMAVHDGGNLQRELHFARGNVNDAWSRCAAIVEDDYVTPRQLHGFMETEGGYVVPGADGSLTVAVGGQHGVRDRMQLARILAMPEEKIRVITSPIGGGFGGKDELTVQAPLALLALKSGRPVRIHLDRHESVCSGRKRNPMRIHMRTGCDANGRLIAQAVDLLMDCGAYASLSPSVLETALEHACGPYEIANVRTRGRLAYTNNGLCGAFRGFGANQMTFAVESQIARLADRLGIDPIAMRRINLRKPSTPGYLSQKVAPTERLAEMLDAAEASDLWHQPRGLSADNRSVIGVGMALCHQGNGLGSILPDSGAAHLGLSPAGRITAAYGLDEMGQGLLAIIQASVAAAVGCDRDDVEPITGDTARAPDSGSTSASRGTYVVWKGADLAGPELSRKLREAAAAVLNRPVATLMVAPGGIREARANSDELLISFGELAAQLAPEALPRATCIFDYPKADYRAGNARFIFAFGATLARVAVDRATGQVRVLELDQHSAAGPVLDPASYVGQMEGGSVQGLGFTLTEDVRVEGGRVVTDNFDSYMMPSIADAPDRMRVFAMEDLDDEHGPRGIGELGIGSATPAIAAAIADATGHWPTVTPIPPEATLTEMMRSEQTS
ncbi:MAG TPA: molybdopterin cofactor-binding domain-containing protein [Xanthobacteraceae bacterium]|nr:molybdopterin cofactor-binding domain-containing protein [Xanthobacteraceae bacterium]